MHSQRRSTAISGATGRLGCARVRLHIPLIALLLICAAQALAAPPQYPDMMPVSRIKPGMKGYGLTTFHGVTISRFNVTVIGVLKNANSGHDLILIRMKGGPITERGANLIHGMSGSPVYIDGKIIGAFSQGEQWPKEPIGMVTPIQDMLEAWDPNIPQKPAYFQPTAARARNAAVSLQSPINIGSRKITRIVLGAPASLTSSSSTAALHYATAFLYAPGAREANRLWLQKALDAKGWHYTVVAEGGVSGVGEFKGAPLKPGSCFGTMLATGDIPFGGYGTLTYRKGDRVLGFGHPLMGLGALEGAITSAYVVDVFSGLQTSHLIPMAGPVVGTLRQDRDFSVSGELSSSPNLIPFDVTINDDTTHRSQTFHERLLQHPDLTAQLMTFVAKEAISRVHDIPGDVMASVTTSIDAAEIGTLTRTNTVYDSVDLSGSALMDLSEITGVVSGNPFYPLPIRSGKVSIHIRSGHETAAVERIFLTQGKFEPGGTLDIGVVLKPYGRPEITRTISLRIPENTPGGRYTLIVRGGMANVVRVGGMVFGGGGDPSTPPANIKQMARQVSERESNTDIVARILLNAYSPAVGGQKLSQMPPNLEALMRSERNSGVRLEREDVRTRIPAGCIVTGSQQLSVNIVRKNSLEQPASGMQNLPAGVGGGPGQSAAPPAGVLGGGAAIGESAGDSVASPALPAEVMAYSLTPNFANLPHPLAEGWNAGGLPAATGSPQSKQTLDEAGKPPTGFKVIEPDRPGASASEAPAEKTEKPVGRQPAVWRQTARADFVAGKFSGTSVSLRGELRVSGVLSRLAASSETYIWSLVSDGRGTLYAGTGTNGKILRIEASGRSTVFAELPVVAVQTLLVARDGTLWAGTGANGAVYHVMPDGKATLVCTLTEHFALALAEDSKGNIYIGAGGGGNIYRLTPFDRRALHPAAPPAIFYRTKAQHILALAVDSDDSLLAGAAPEGVLYRISPDGRGKVLYDARDNAIMAIATAPASPSVQQSNGSHDVYIATGPRGSVVAVHPDGSTSVLYDHAPMFFTAIKASSDGSLFASTAAAVYHISPPTPGDGSPAVVAPLDNSKDVDYLCLALLPNGSVAAGTGNIGEVYVSTGISTGAANLTSGVSSGTYESVVRDARFFSHWGAFRWEGSAPSGATVRVSTRTGDAAEPDGTWSDWTAVRFDSRGAEGRISSPPARYIQYRMELIGAASGESPVVREISLSYMPKNQAPKVSFVSPSGGEQWSRTQTVRWNAVDPDNDTLSYVVEYSTDNGSTWRRLSAGDHQADIKPKGPDATALSSHSSSAESVAEFEKKLDPTMPPFMRQIAIDRHKAVLESGGIESSQRDSFRAWDTQSVPDGTYLLRVSASDRASNPIDSLTTVVVSAPIVVCNSAPIVRITGKPEVRSDRSVSIRGVALQALASVTAVQYRIDGGEWIAATPDDGIFDSGREGFQFVTAPVLPGKHAIEVMGFNSAGEHSSVKLDVTSL